MFTDALIMFSLIHQISYVSNVVWKKKYNFIWINLK